MALLLGIDTGGTYTDAVLYDDAAGVVAAAKALTTKHDLLIGIREAVERALAEGAGGEQGAIGMVSISTTLATNALVEGHGSPVCLLLLGYDRQALDRAELGRALAGDPVEFLPGGHNAIGVALEPLDPDATRRAIEKHDSGVGAFAVSGMFAVRNPEHEAAVRDLIHRTTDKPVTCGHDMTANLDAPRRALTAVLNARLIPDLARLIDAVRTLLEEREIAAPLMVVRGDGSLIDADVARARPVETILSGPAASLIGALHLSGERDAVVADMGGTTSDIAVLRDGRPAIRRDGARVGGWRTMVEAAAVHTVGLGGDSEVRFADTNPGEKQLVVGPARAVPLSLLATDNPAVLRTLELQADGARPGPLAGRFVARLRPFDGGVSGLGRHAEDAWEAIAKGPVALQVFAEDQWLLRALRRLVDRGLAVYGAFSPSDAAHVLGLQGQWDETAARLGAEIVARQAAGKVAPFVDVEAPGAEAVSRAVLDRVVLQSSRALVAAALAEESSQDGMAMNGAAAPLLDRALGGAPSVPGRDLIGLSLTLARPLIGVGAPAAVHYPETAKRLNTRLVVPPHAGVANAVGAVVGSVRESLVATITEPVEGRFRAHMPDGISDWPSLQDAADHVERALGRLATAQADTAGAAEVHVSFQRDDTVVEDGMGGSVFFESRLTATAVGRPRIAAD